jgi:hypothetical protein
MHYLKNYNLNIVGSGVITLKRIIYELILRCQIRLNLPKVECSVVEHYLPMYCITTQLLL